MGPPRRRELKTLDYTIFEMSPLALCADKRASRSVEVSPPDDKKIWRFTRGVRNADVEFSSSSDDKIRGGNSRGGSAQCRARCDCIWIVRRLQHWREAARERQLPARVCRRHGRPHGDGLAARQADDLKMPVFAQAVLEKAALDSAAAGAGTFQTQFMDAVYDGRILLWILIAAVVYLILRSFRRST